MAAAVVLTPQVRFEDGMLCHDFRPGMPVRRGAELGQVVGYGDEWVMVRWADRVEHVAGLRLELLAVAAG